MEMCHRHCPVRSVFSIYRSSHKPNEPYVVQYNAHDTSGNFVEPAIRHAYVNCTGNSKLCALSDGTHYCSVSATQCLEPTPSSPMIDSILTAPVLELVGPAYVEILQGQPYGACNDFIQLSMPCDRGATALSSIDGDVAWMVMACAEGYTFATYGLQGCSLDTSLVGSHTIKFFIAHGSIEPAAYRTIRVLETCPGVRNSVLIVLQCTMLRPAVHLAVLVCMAPTINS